MASNTSTPASADEQPKQDIAKHVVTPKRRYFFPHHGLSVLAGTMKDAEAKLKELTGTKRKRAAKPANSSVPTPEPETQPVAPQADVKAGDA